MFKNKADTFYYDNFKEIAAICVQSANYLLEFLTNYDVSKIEESLKTMHEYEHSADIKRHEMAEKLSKAFITPIEREDLAELSASLDNIADTIEEVMQRFYMDEPKEVKPEAIDLAQKILASCKGVESMFGELHNFKKPVKLREYIVEINNCEEECDVIYIEAYKNVKKQCTNFEEVVCWRKIYDYLERCIDSCEHVADIVDMVILKNT